MPRETKKKVKETQGSEGSDEGFAVTVAQQVQTSWEKKKRENEAKFLAAARAELDACGKEKTACFVKEANDMQVILDRFVSDYAAVEDRIRNLWQELLVAHAASLETSKKHHAAAVDMDQTREKGQVRGMAISKKAVEDCGKLIFSLSESE
ncbi:tuberous sclerosis 2 protein-like protein [Phanerochaete sordida]|uniref:Tuberous sclerosis 2 protein-like protein n=1 Tax=Phanerochaete sordida TaxID=48140 RepID=A0A9P3LL67_9APHY|nr:tuberous sclerosis 2 protein-like protein [Phanerochaete sordida]